MSQDDQRMKELADRLVAMAPEPPPFPEEEVVLSKHTKSYRPRPAVAFAGAALLVLIGAAIPLLFLDSNGQEPVATTSPPVTEAPPVETTQAPGTTEPATETSEPTETTVATSVVGTTVFFVQDPQNSRTGNPALVSFWTEVVVTGELPELGNQGQVQLERLRLLSDENLTAPPGHYSAVPAEVEFLAVAHEERTVTLEMNEEFRSGAGGLLADVTMLNQIVYTATDASGADVVRFVIDGQEIVDFGSDGLDLTGGVTRETFRDSLNLIVVTQPLIFGGDGLPQVEGIANVFEATVSLEIVSAGGEVEYTDFTTATCGTGCWGDFAFTLDTSALTPDSQVRVFWNSPEDGSRSDVVYVPIDEDGVWELTTDR